MVKIGKWKAKKSNIGDTYAVAWPKLERQITNIFLFASGDKMKEPNAYGDVKFFAFHEWLGIFNSIVYKVCDAGGVN